MSHLNWWLPKAYTCQRIFRKAVWTNTMLKQLCNNHGAKSAVTMLLLYWLIFFWFHPWQLCAVWMVLNTNWQNIDFERGLWRYGFVKQFSTACFAAALLRQRERHDILWKMSRFNRNEQRKHASLWRDVHKAHDYQTVETARNCSQHKYICLWI